MFSGCGGMSLGFEWNGFKEQLAIDKWKDALATYEYNRKNTHTLCADLSCLSPDKVKEDYNITNVDVIIVISSAVVKCLENIKCYGYCSFSRNHSRLHFSLPYF